MAATLDDVVGELQKVNTKLTKVTRWLKKTYPNDEDFLEDGA